MNGHGHMNNLLTNNAMAKVIDALDEQAIELRLLQRNLKDLSFEFADLQATLMEYDGALQGVGNAARLLGSVAGL